MIYIESFGALCPVVFSIPIYLFCQTSCSLSQSGSCPSLCDSFLKNSSDTRVCYKDHGNEITTDNISNGLFKIDGEVVNTKNLQNCAKGCNGSESGASKLHAGVVGVLLGSIALAFMC